MNLLDQIASPVDLKRLEPEQLPQLCAEIRTYFIETILRNGGHFSANLGVVELTVALHYVFDFLEDRLVWDVGHQSYIHKLLTGRKEALDGIRHFEGLSGFPKRAESPYDHFGTGHSSTSISAALGMAEAARMNQLAREHVAVIGDGSLTGGMALEALNNVGISSAQLLVIINDNQMGIDPNTGALGRHLRDIDPRDNLFTHLGLRYHGPLDGHDVIGLVRHLQAIQHETGARVLHLRTLKGKGYTPAEEEQVRWHSVKYVKVDQQLEPEDERPKFQQIFGETLLELAAADPRVIGVTPAMPSGSSMDLLMRQMPERVFDVGIAEQHAITFSAGLALEGKRPFCHLYSSFFQRGLDQLIHDVALQGIPVIFCLDRAGLVGEDGPTHHGLFDVALLHAVPGIKIVSPMDLRDLRDAMHWALDQTGPVVIRYPKGGGDATGLSQAVDTGLVERAKVRNEGDRLAILSVGSIGEEVLHAIREGGWEKQVHHLDLSMLQPLDMGAISQVLDRFEQLIIVEELPYEGGICQRILSLTEASHTLHSLHVADPFAPHGSLAELRAHYGIDSAGIQRKIREVIQAI